MSLGGVPKNIKNASPEQKKIIYISLIALLSLACLLIFIIMPQSKRLSRLREEFTETERQIREITDITKGRELAQAIKELKADLILASGSFPNDDEDVISGLSEIAKKSKVEIRNISPEDMRPIEDKVIDYQILEMPVTLSLSCEFRELGEFLQLLRDSPSLLVRVRELDIKGNGEGQPNLDVALKVTAYMARFEK